MPIYVYVCSSCGYEFEKSLSVDERLTPTFQLCPSCNKLTVNKIIPEFSLKIKGYSSKNGFSKNVGDVEKHLGRELTNNDLED